MSKINNIKNVLICGGGLMGSNIAFVVSSVKEYEITVYDKFPVDVEAKIRMSTKQLVEKRSLLPRNSRKDFPASTSHRISIPKALRMLTSLSKLYSKTSTLSRKHLLSLKNAADLTASSAQTPLL
jgi:3-hydroxyacyl-CoA dehydrogenase